MVHCKAWGSYGVSPKLHFRSPQGIIVDSSGNVYVADTGNSRIVKYSANGTFLTSWGSYGLTAVLHFNSPKGITVDLSGNVYVADTGNSRIAKYSANGTFLTSWGSYGYGDFQLKGPASIGGDSGGNLYVADTNNHRILAFTKQNDTKGNIGTVNLLGKNVTINDSNLTAQLVFKGLTFPTRMAFLGSNDMLVLAAEKDNGTVQRIVNGQKLKEPLLSVNLGKEPNKGCLCGIDIGREVNGTTHVFVYYYIKTEGTGTPIGIYLNRYDLLNNKLVNPKLVLYVPKSRPIDT